jgi:hypothetical protein
VIIVKLHYGLGNQLFQYALARSLSIRKNVDFRLDKHFFSTNLLSDHPRIYQLDQFNILEQFAEHHEVQRFTEANFLLRRWRTQENRFLEYYERKLVREQKLDFDPNIFRVDDDSYLFGFWQDLRYFSPIEDTLKKELTFRNPPDPINAAMLEKIMTTPSISLHIRRGDYLTDPYTLANVGMCDLRYYSLAAEAIAGHVANPVFYIFSDDMIWVRENFHIPFPVVFVDHNSQSTAYEDLRLISHCKHHIMANSSFSWWGAWLGVNVNKIVIGPRVWRKNGPNMFLPYDWKTI